MTVSYTVSLDDLVAYNRHSIWRGDRMKPAILRGRITISAFLFVIVLLAFTYLQVILSRRWVYYAGGDE